MDKPDEFESFRAISGYVTAILPKLSKLEDGKVHPFDALLLSLHIDYTISMFEDSLTITQNGLCLIGELKNLSEACVDTFNGK